MRALFGCIFVGSGARSFRSSFRCAFISSASGASTHLNCPFIGRGSGLRAIFRCSLIAGTCGFLKCVSIGRAGVPQGASGFTDYLANLLETVEMSRDVCRNSRWKKFTFAGKDIIIRDVADKLRTWIDIFKNIGDIVGRYDPVHGCQLWREYGGILVDIEMIAKVVVRCVVYEEIYLTTNPKSPNHGAVEKSIVLLYSDVLEFLALSKTYLLHNSAESSLRKEIMTTEAQVRSSEHSKRMAMIEELNTPIRGIDSTMTSVYDELQAEDLMKDTGKWLLNSKQFQEWRASSASEILWLHGIPGGGKTKLTCKVIENLRSLKEQVDYFYCNRSEPERRDPTAILRAMMKQLSVGLPYKIVNEYDKWHGKHSQTTIIVEALDEIHHQKRSILLEALKTIITSAKSLVKTTGNKDDLERFTRRGVADAIRKGRLLRSSVSGELEQRVVNALLAEAHGTFLRVNLQLRYLCEMKSECDVVEKLGKLPSDLEKTYSDIYATILSEPGRNPEIAEIALMWIICSPNPLSPEMWSMATGWVAKLPRPGGADPKALLDICHGLVTLDSQSNVMRLAHLANHMAAEACLSALTECDGLVDESNINESFFLYSSINWGYHVDRRSSYYRFGEEFPEIWEWDKFDINSENEVGGTLLLLIANGADINAGKAIMEGDNPLLAAMRHGKDLVAVLDAGLGRQVTELVLEATAGNMSCAKELMKLFLSINPEIGISESIVEAAAETSSGGMVMELLLSTGIDITESTMEEAVRNEGSVEIMELLLSITPTS
ncbi:hypothetical protein BZA05DRAFT_419195 [Tricharina praecox]|uniref:uncharacterized protein n=1 Tax=Tricharina praecox TaxID=43433 RepID=UPI00221F2A01|nr:uncharacterized protein BZA05DRAFT_419195 [Tricharina praecox]KAI5850678.1 hypothetical protein BZA05DRAFT_419195 [Tricharina praecox]